MLFFFCFGFFHLLPSSEINLPNFHLIYLYRLICKTLEVSTVSSKSAGLYVSGKIVSVWS